jgi:hypothetical protein
MSYDCHTNFRNHENAQPTAHQLARILLSLPDLPVIFDGLGKDLWLVEVGQGEIGPAGAVGTPVVVIEITDKKI